MAAAKGKPAQKGGRGWMVGMACGMLIVLAAPTALLLAVMLLPGIFAWMVDRLPGRPVGMIVLVCGLTLTIGPLATLWSGGGEWIVCRDILSRITTPAGAWMAQGGGWLAAELAPVMARLFIELKVAAQASMLRSARAKLEAAWGLPPSDPPS